MGTKCACLKVENIDAEQLTTSSKKPENKESLSPGFKRTEKPFSQATCQNPIHKKIQQTKLDPITEQENLDKNDEILSLASEFSNPLTLSTERKLGPYIYFPAIDDGIKKIKKNPIILENNAVYHGE